MSEPETDRTYERRTHLVGGRDLPHLCPGAGCAVCLWILDPHAWQQFPLRSSAYPPDREPEVQP